MKYRHSQGVSFFNYKMETINIDFILQNICLICSHFNSITLELLIHDSWSLTLHFLITTIKTTTFKRELEHTPLKNLAGEDSHV